VVKEGGKPASQRERSDEGEGSGAREPIRNGPRVGQADGAQEPRSPGAPQDAGHRER
jgi:hypothetical protein